MKQTFEKSGQTKKLRSVQNKPQLHMVKHNTGNTTFFSLNVYIVGLTISLLTTERVNSGITHIEMRCQDGTGRSSITGSRSNWRINH